MKRSLMVALCGILVLGGCGSPRAAATVPAKLIAPVNASPEAAADAKPYLPQPGCTPKSCRSAHANCGTLEDGCGAVISCGPCEEQLICGGAGLPNVCGSQICVAKTCAGVHARCGHAFDGCGNILDCGGCGPGQTCGGNAANQCG